MHSPLKREGGAGRETQESRHVRQLLGVGAVPECAAGATGQSEPPRTRSTVRRVSSMACQLWKGGGGGQTGLPREQACGHRRLQESQRQYFCIPGRPQGGGGRALPQHAIA